MRQRMMPSTRYVTALVISYAAALNGLLLELHTPKSWPLFLVILCLVNVALLTLYFGIIQPYLHGYFLACHSCSEPHDEVDEGNARLPELEIEMYQYRR